MAPYLQLSDVWYPGDVSQSVGNAGLLDIQTALKWLQLNVAAFGGALPPLAGSIPFHLLFLRHIRLRVIVTGGLCFGVHGGRRRPLKGDRLRTIRGGLRGLPARAPAIQQGPAELRHHGVRRMLRHRPRYV